MNKYILLLVILTGQLCASKSFATSSDKAVACNELIKECFAYSAVERSTCFYTAGTHSFCNGLEIGKLAMKRWSMSPVRHPGLESAPAFLGQNLVNSECISNFDTRWSAAMLENEVPPSLIHDLYSQLNKCTVTDSDELIRP